MTSPKTKKKKGTIVKKIIFFWGFVFLACSVYAADYYVAAPPAGADNNPGTPESPFATISKAASIMGPGDVCFIREGIYDEQIKPAKSGTAGQTVRFQAYNNEKVYVTGTATVPRHHWQNYRDAVMKADVSDLGAVSQVFMDWKRMDMARFPNLDNDDLLEAKFGRAVDAAARKKPQLSEFIDPQLNIGDVDWTGADLWLLTGLKWVAFHSTVEEHTGPVIKFVFPGDISYAYQPEPGSDYFIYGDLDALDVEKEWFYDDNEKNLYFYPPSGDLDVRIRVRQWGADLTGKKYIEIDGLNFFAANLNLDGAEGCLIENCNVYYPVVFYHADAWAHTEDPRNGKGAGVKLGGTGNTVRSCRIAFSWGDGISIYGTGNTVENCLIHDINWLCTDNAAVHTSGRDHLIKGNTLHRAARSGLVHRKSKNLRIEYNDIYDCGLICTDLGATYCWQTDGEGTEIHHNWVHDVVTTAHTAGIYLDNGSSNFLVHHNVVWNTDDLAMQTNLDAFNHEIYNNTFWNCSRAMGGGGGNEQMEGQIVYNNLSNSGDWFGNDVSNNLTVSDPKFVDAANGDFRLKADSPARDDYQYVPEFINGGFESGTGGWTGAGAELKQVSSPVHSGSFAAHASNRNQYWEGARQTITDIIKTCGPGRYTIEAWVRLASGSTNGYLRFKLVDDTGDDYPGIQRPLNSTEWRKLSYATNISWQGELREAVFELMTTGSDNALPDLYIDDCALMTPENGGGTGPVGGIMLPGITDDVLDGKPDAGAYEYGGSNANWTAGSTLKPVTPFANGIDSGADNIPEKFALYQNYPNPFNPDTYIRFDLHEPSHVKIEIYNVLGHRVRTLLDGRQSSGSRKVRWDGRNDGGRVVAAGMYFYVFECSGRSGSFEAVEKMLLLR